MERQNRREGVVGLFSDYGRAEQAIYELRNLGIPNDDMKLALPDEERGDQIRDTGVEVIRKGGLSGVLSGIGLGGSSIEGTMRNMGFSEDLAHHYADQVDAGNILLIVGCDAGSCGQAASILQQYGAMEVQSSIAGASFGREPAAYGTGYASGTMETTTSGQTTTPGPEAYPPRQKEGMIGREAERTSMPIREERPVVGKERAQTGEVEVRKEVVEEQRNITVPVSHEEVVVTKHPTGEQPSEAGVGEDQTIRVPVSEERVNIGKETVTTGEVEVQKQQVTEEQQVSGTVKKEVPRIEKQGDIDVNESDEDIEKRRRAA